MSFADLRVDPGRKRFVGRTDNVARLTLDVSQLETADSITIEIDGQSIPPIAYPSSFNKVTLFNDNGRWSSGESSPPSHKGPHRYGTFKDVFNHRVVFVFGSKGSNEENDWAFAKARFDAETFWYQGNGSIEVIRDVDFDPSEDPDRNVVLYGNAKTNAAWQALLGNNPVQVLDGEIQIGDKNLTGDNLGVLLIRPRLGSDIACVGAVGGTGIVGMRLTDRRPYLHPGFAYPDLVVFCSGKSTQEEAVRAAGFFGLDWSVGKGEFVWDNSGATN
jgi:hypothetical protein